MLEIFGQVWINKFIPGPAIVYSAKNLRYTDTQNHQWLKSLYLNVGIQFTSKLFTELVKFLGRHKITTSPYRRQSSGIIKRLQRQLKVAILSREQSHKWVEKLPVVLLCLSSLDKEDISATLIQEIKCLMSWFSCCPKPYEQNICTCKERWKDRDGHVKKVKPEIPYEFCLSLTTSAVIELCDHLYCWAWVRQIFFPLYSAKMLANETHLSLI